MSFLLFSLPVFTPKVENNWFWNAWMCIHMPRSHLIEGEQMKTLITMYMYDKWMDL